MVWRVLTKEWWSEKGVTRLGVAGAALASAALTTLFSMGSSVLLSDWQRTNDHRSQQVSALVDSMVQFQVFASAFSTEVFAAGKPPVEARARLIQNLNDQYARLAAADAFLPVEAKGGAEAYLRAIEATVAAVNRVDGVESMGDFWSRVSDLTVIRKSLTPELEASI